MNIYGIILAAGVSSRMGESKQLLQLGEITILEHVINLSLSEDFSKILAVIGHEAEKIKRTILIDDSRLYWVENESYFFGQSTSINAAIKEIDESQLNIMMFLGDLPFISFATVHAIYQAGYEQLQKISEPFIIQPTYKGIPGHPVFFGNLHKNFFAVLKGDQGAKLLMKDIHCHLKFAVEDWGIIFDLDTPEEYETGKFFVK